jgi:hypothetical protein
VVSSLCAGLWGTLHGAAQAVPLTIVNVSPRGEVGSLSDGDQIRVTFSAPMVPLGTIPSGTAPPWNHIAPAAEGNWYWSGTKTLMFSPDVSRRLPFATTFTVRVDASATSADGHVEEIDDDGLAWLWNSNMRATAVVLDGFSRRHDDTPLMAPLVRWLTAARTNGRWATTHENAMALEAFVSYYRAFERDVPDLLATVKVASTVAGRAAFKGRSPTAQQLRMSMPDLLTQMTASASPSLSIAREGTGRLYYNRARAVRRARARYSPRSRDPRRTSLCAIRERGAQSVSDIVQRGGFDSCHRFGDGARRGALSRAHRFAAGRFRAARRLVPNNRDRFGATGDPDIGG